MVIYVHLTTAIFTCILIGGKLKHVVTDRRSLVTGFISTAEHTFILATKIAPPCFITRL